MAIRNRQIHPDQMYPTQTFGNIPIISGEALAAAMVEAASWVDFAGGTFTLVTVRHPTDAPNEMVTIRAMVQWKDRTDARPQPEERAELDPYVEETPAPMPFKHEPLEDGAALTEAEIEQHFPTPAASGDDIGDGIIEAELPEEDDSEIPAEVR